MAIETKKTAKQQTLGDITSAAHDEPMQSVTLEMLRFFLESRGYPFHSSVTVQDKDGVKVIRTESTAKAAIEILRKMPAKEDQP